MKCWTGTVCVSDWELLNNQREDQRDALFSAKLLQLCKAAQEKGVPETATWKVLNPQRPLPPVEEGQLEWDGIVYPVVMYVDA